MNDESGTGVELKPFLNVMYTVVPLRLFGLYSELVGSAISRWSSW